MAKLFTGDTVREVENINEYLLAGPCVGLESRNESISGFPRTVYGVILLDDGHLTFTEQEKQEAIDYFQVRPEYFKRLLSGSDVLYGTSRYCLYLKHAHAKTLANPFIKDRITKTRAYRLQSPDKTTNSRALEPHKFLPKEYKCPETYYLAIPICLSDNRKYIPCDFMPSGTIPTSQLHTVPLAGNFIFGIMVSNLMMLWTKTIGGKMRTHVRFSSELCYNTFPFPKITDEQRDKITEAAKGVRLARARHPEKNLAQMYDPDKMPDNLREAHDALDSAIESCYTGYPFKTDEDRVECLFKLYHEMTKGGEK